MDLKRLQLQVAQSEAVARLEVAQTEIEARSAEMAVLALATGSATKLLATDQVVLRKMRHADDDIGGPKRVHPTGANQPDEKINCFRARRDGGGPPATPPSR